MGDFYLPFHFVPVAKGGRRGDLSADEFRKGRVENARHDQYLEKTKSGTVMCTVEAAGPVFIGHQRDGEEVKPYKLDGRPALPASSLRGLIGALSEAASNSSPRVLSRNVLGQPCYSFRKPMQKPLSAIGMLRKNGDRWELEPVCLPLLQYDPRGNLRGRHAALEESVCQGTGLPGVRGGSRAHPARSRRSERSFWPEDHFYSQGRDPGGALEVGGRREFERRGAQAPQHQTESGTAADGGSAKDGHRIEAAERAGARAGVFRDYPPDSREQEA